MIEIDIVDYDTLETLTRSVESQRSSPPEDGHEMWVKYHEELCSVASRYGTVSSDYETTVDFYFSGDWFHQDADGFALQTIKGIRRDALHEFQRVVAKHNPNASLSLDGDFESEINGLEIFITPDAILVAWRHETQQICKQRLCSMGIVLDSKANNGLLHTGESRTPRQSAES